MLGVYLKFFSKYVSKNNPVFLKSTQQMDTSIMDITFLHDDETLSQADCNESVLETPFHNRLNFSMLLSSDPSTAITSPINNRKRKRSQSNNSSSSDTNQTSTPPNKKPRISSTKSSSSSTLHPINENAATFQLQPSYVNIFKYVPSI